MNDEWEKLYEIAGVRIKLYNDAIISRIKSSVTDANDCNYRFVGIDIK